MFGVKPPLSSPKAVLARRVATVATGAAGAQFVTLVFSPILSRIYGPEAFGVFGTAMALIAISVPLVTAGLPLALILPERDSEAFLIARVAISVIVFISAAGGAALIMSGLIWEILPDDESQETLLVPLLVVIATLLGGLALLLTQLAARQKMFSTIAKISVANALLSNGFRALFGLFHAKGVALLAAISLASAIQVAMFLWALSLVVAQIRPLRVNAGELVRTISIHRDFPLYRTPQVVLSQVSRNVPLLFLAAFADASTVGLYALAHLALATPSRILSQSVSQVFYPYFSEAAHQGQKHLQPLVQSTAAIAALGLLPFGLVAVAGPSLFAFVFGAEWEVAGIHAQLLSPMLFMHFINSPSVALIPVVRLQRWLLLYEVFSTSARTAAIALGLVLFDDAFLAIGLYSAAGAVAYFTLILVVMQRTVQMDKGLVNV